MSRCAHEHNHDHDDDEDNERGIEFSLYLRVNMDQVECLNEAVEGSGRQILKPWDERCDRSRYVESDVDQELIFNIPFTGMVKLKGIVLIGGEGGSHPRYMRLFKNRPNMTFDDAECEPAQMFELTRDETGFVEYGTKVVKFSSIHHLTLHFPENYGAECTRIYYIGLRGEFQEAFRDKVAIATYEARAMPQDHKGEIPEPNWRPVS